MEDDFEEKTLHSFNFYRNRAEGVLFFCIGVFCVYGFDSDCSSFPLDKRENMRYNKKNTSTRIEKL